MRQSPVSFRGWRFVVTVNITKKGTVLCGVSSYKCQLCSVIGLEAATPFLKRNTQDHSTYSLDVVKMGVLALVSWMPSQSLPRTGNLLFSPELYS